MPVVVVVVGGLLVLGRGLLRVGLGERRRGLWRMLLWLLRGRLLERLRELSWRIEK